MKRSRGIKRLNLNWDVPLFSSSPWIKLMQQHYKMNTYIKIITVGLFFLIGQEPFYQLNLC